MDPHSERYVAAGGATPSDDRGGALIFIEETRDFARDQRIDPATLEQDVVVHEVGHAFRKGTDPVTLFEERRGAIRYREDYLLQIRSVEKPASR